MEVPPPHYTLQPAGQTGGGLHPGRRSPGGEGGEMVLGNNFLIQWECLPVSLSSLIPLVIVFN